MDKIINTIRFYVLNCASLFLILFLTAENGINAAFAIGYMFDVILFVPIYTFIMCMVDVFLCKYRILSKWYKAIIYSLMPWLLLVIYGYILWSSYNPEIVAFEEYAAPWYCNDLYIIPIIFVICAIIGFVVNRRDGHQ